MTVFENPGERLLVMMSAGNLAITVQKDFGAHTCYYGPCEYTSARLITQNKVEIGSGRIETRLACIELGPERSPRWFLRSSWPASLLRR